VEFEKEERGWNEMPVNIDKEPKIIWVKNWKDIPGKYNDSSVVAHVDIKTNQIYAIEGKATEADILHEIYHTKKTTRNKYDRKREYMNPAIYIREELEATKYAWDKSGKPKHILMRLRALYNDLCFRMGNIGTQNAIRIIGNELRFLHPPIEWLKDFQNLKSEANMRK